MGNEYGDAQNSAVRVFLNQFSKKLPIFLNNKYKQKTLEYFGNKCPYSGEVVSEDRFVKDHIIPINKEKCGLHVYGNVLFVTREANAKKHSRSLEEYLKDDPEKLAKIEAFRRRTGYIEFHKKYHCLLQKACTILYENVGNAIKNDLTEFMKSIDLDKLVWQIDDSIE